MIVRRGAEQEQGAAILSRCDVRGGPSARVGTLSGGNQQKVLFARMLLREPLSVADEPTRGVDIGAKQAIYDMLVSLPANGMGVLLISSEIEEILGSRTGSS